MEGQPDDAERGEISYELDEWSQESRQLLDRLLTTNSVNHAWQGGTLTVGPDDEALVDELLDEVEANLAPGLDPDVDKLVYEVAEWSTEDHADLVDALNEAGIRHVFDEMGDLVVEAIDEDRVDTIIDELADEDDDGDDGPPAIEVLGRLFVAADKLRLNPRDGRAIGDVLNHTAMVVAMSAPYGIERQTWARIGLRAGALRTLLEDEAPDDEEVVVAADELRELLHPMV